MEGLNDQHILVEKREFFLASGPSFNYLATTVCLFLSLKIESASTDVVLDKIHE